MWICKIKDKALIEAYWTHTAQIIMPRMPLWSYHTFPVWMDSIVNLTDGMCVLQYSVLYGCVSAVAL